MHLLFSALIVVSNVYSPVKHFTQIFYICMQNRQKLEIWPKGILIFTLKVEKWHNLCPHRLQSKAIREMRRLCSCICKVGMVAIPAKLTTFYHYQLAPLWHTRCKQHLFSLRVVSSLKKKTIIRYLACGRAPRHVYSCCVCECGFSIWAWSVLWLQERCGESEVGVWPLNLVRCFCGRGMGSKVRPWQAEHTTGIMWKVQWEERLRRCEVGVTVVRWCCHTHTGNEVRSWWA